jgi:hypothetical protein
MLFNGPYSLAVIYRFYEIGKRIVLITRYYHTSLIHSYQIDYDNSG